MPPHDSQHQAIESTHGDKSLRIKKPKRQSRSSDSLRDANTGMMIEDLCRTHGFTEPSYYAWMARFGGMSVSDAPTDQVAEGGRRAVGSER